VGIVLAVVAGFQASYEIFREFAVGFIGTGMITGVFGRMLFQKAISNSAQTHKLCSCQKLR
jgi:hypothetical protein